MGQEEITIDGKTYIVTIPDKPDAKPPVATKDAPKDPPKPGPRAEPPIAPERENPDYYDYRNAFAQGLTQNWAGEAAGGLGAAWDYAKGDKNLSKNYERRRDDIESTIKESEERFPKTNLAGNIAGGLTSALASGIGATRGLSLGPRVAQSAKTSTILGAAGGAGGAEPGWENRLRGALTGGGIGLGLGVGVPLVTAGIGAGVRRIADTSAGQAVADWMPKWLGGKNPRMLPGGTPPPGGGGGTPTPAPSMQPQLPAGQQPRMIGPGSPGQPPPGAGGAGGGSVPPGGPAVPGGVQPQRPPLSKRGAEKVIEAFRRHGYSVEQAEAYLKSYGSPDMRIVDVGDELRHLGDQAVMTPSNARAPMMDFIHDRAHDAGERVYDAVQKVSGVKRDVSQYVEALQNTLQKRLSPIYDRIFDANQHHIDAPEILKFFRDRPIFRKFYEGAVEDMQNQGKQDPGALTLRVIDNVKRRIDDFISKEAVAGATKASQHGLRKVRDEFLQVVDSHFPEYGNIRGRYADVLKMLDAAQDGQDFMKLRPEDLAKTMHKLGDDWLRQAYRVGAVAKIRDTVLGPNRNVNSYQQIMGGRYAPARMETLFGSAKGYRDFLGRLNAEREMRYASGIGAGSQSGRRLLSQGEFTDDLADATGRAITGNVGDAASGLVKSVFKGNSAPMSEAVLPILHQDPMTTFPFLRSVEEGLQKNARKPAALPSLLGTFAGKAGGLFGQ